MEKSKVKARILLVEDDPNLSAVLVDYLEMLGYGAIHAKDGEEGFRVFSNNVFDLCILDIMMPKKDGFALANEIREVNKLIPIIFLTAKGLKEDRIAGFMAGCDDYITKPFSSEELSLRIDAILRRCMIMENEPTVAKDEIFELGKYKFDTANMLLKSSAGSRTLTRKEAALLRLLCLNKNKLLTREEALLNVWGDDDYFIGRSMDVFITKLRKYLKEDENISILNVHGAGFKFEVKE
ncbi:MAG: response regulator transcription factor [Bacteroidales bacterium]|nr:response regulator transcription factor [Bacteroidales bacterium]